jgi:putative ABC transport system substrate-binding protein
MQTLVQACTIAFATAFFATASVAQSIKTSKVGFLGPASQLDELRSALAKLGYVEGTNIVIDAQWPADDRLDQLAAIAEAFVGSKVDVIVAIGASAARAAKATTAQIPIVFAGVVNPVTTGLVTDLAKPDGNVTGATTFDPEHARTQIELLKEVLPGLARLGILSDSGAAPAMYQSNDDAARAAGLATVVLKVERGAPDFDDAFATAKKDGVQAILVLSTPVTTPHRRRIAEASIRYKIPVMSPRDHADAGGLLSYGTSFSAATRKAATYVAKILDGANPSELPIEMVRQHELVINKKTSDELGVALPGNFVSRAHQVIE